MRQKLFLFTKKKRAPRKISRKNYSLCGNASGCSDCGQISYVLVETIYKEKYEIFRKFLKTIYYIFEQIAYFTLGDKMCFKSCDRAILTSITYLFSSGVTYGSSKLEIAQITDLPLKLSIYPLSSINLVMDNSNYYLRLPIYVSHHLTN